VISAVRRDLERLREAGIAGLEPVAELLDAAGRPLRVVLFDFGETLVERVDDSVQPLNELHIVPYADTVPTLEGLRRAGYRLAVVSNTTQSSDEVMRGVLASIGIAQYFDTVVTSYDAGHEKPEPGIFRLALDRLNCPPAQAAMIGNDPVKDVGGAAALGLITVLVGRDWSVIGAGGSAATYTVASLAEIPPLLARHAEGGARAEHRSAGS
jgi:HAD superfamily hydrolase (TIGR01662 family)